jgi:tetratricopeptide (TPR) repeat protein
VRADSTVTEPGQSWDVFVSYASSDVEVARELRARLIRSGWSTFLSEDDLNARVGSAQWSERIDQVLDSAKVLVLLVTPQALESRWVTYEWRSVHDSILSGRSGMLIPICLHGPGPQELPRALRRNQCVDLRTATQWDAGYEEVAALIRGYLAELARVAAARHSTAGRAETIPGPEQPTTLMPRWFSVRPWQSPRGIGLSAVVIVCAAIGVGVLWPDRHERTPVSPVLRPALRIPEQGLHALRLYASPEDATLGVLRSADAWEEAERDFAAAALQPAAPIRWEAARHFAAAQRLFRLGRSVEAEARLRRSLEVDPEWALSYVALSGLLCGKDTKAAVEAAIQARRRDPTLWIAVVALASAYVYGNDLERGIEQYRRALILAPRSSALKGELALALHSAGGQYDQEATRLAREALAATEEVVAAHLVLAEQGLERRDLRQAAEHAERAASLAPRDLRVQLALGDSLQLLDRPIAAQTAWKTAIDLATKAPADGVAQERLMTVTAAVQGQRMPAPRRAMSVTRSRPAKGAGPDRSRPREASPQRSRPRSGVESEVSDPWD